LGASIPFATNGSVAPLAPDLSAQLRVMRAVWDEDFDVLHLHEPLVPGITNTALVVKPCPMVGTFHASGDFSAYSSWLRPLGSWAVRRLDVRVAVSDDARSTAGVWFDDDDMLVLFNAVDTEAFARVTPHEAEGPSIFFVGRHETRKGLAVLLEAMKQLPQDVSLWVAGTGPLTDELQASTVGDDRIEWLGRLSDAERDARMAGATVFCAPAIGGESFGVVLLEAMAAGTPVVASNIPGYTNVGTHDRNALLAEPDDPTALAKALNAVLGDQALAKRLVVAGHQRANAYSMERLAASYEQLYRDAMARTPAAG
ncbi:MAG: glycosyltransferase family 4 protein, partial [Candidatus Microthrix parvicella]